MITMPGGLYLPASRGGRDGKDGKDGSSPEMTFADDAVQWKLDDQTVWKVLLRMSDIPVKNGTDGIDGEDGQDGSDGRSFEMRVAGGYFQGRLEGDATWNNLLQLSTLAGKDGASVRSGATDPTAETGADGDFYINTATLTMFGPKASGIWPAGVNMKGANATTTAEATQTAKGLMSAADKKKLDGINEQSVTTVASGGRPIGTAFTVSATRNARVNYTFNYTLTATLTLGQNITIIATVDGVEVGRISDAILLGLAGSTAINRSMSFSVQAGKQVLFTKTGTAAVTATIVSGQETLL